MVQHCMAVRADGHKVRQRIDDVVRTYRGKVDDMVNVHESSSERAERSLKVEVADFADRTEMGKAPSSSLCATLESIDQRVRDGALVERSIAGHLIGIHTNVGRD